MKKTCACDSFLSHNHSLTGTCFRSHKFSRLSIVGEHTWQNRHKPYWNWTTIKLLGNACKRFWGFSSAVSFSALRWWTALWGFSVRLTVGELRVCSVMPWRFHTHTTAGKKCCRHIHSPHKSARDVLRSPFPIELPEPRPIGGNEGFKSRVLALCLSNFDAFTLSLFEFAHAQLESCNSEHKISPSECPCQFSPCGW